MDERGPERHLFYLHGRIVQEKQSPRPEHPEYGVYEYESIVETLRKRGFTVHSEIRPRVATVSESADRVIEKIRALLASGVRPDRITVVGASMGASIAFLASVRMRNRDLRFGILAACLSANVKALVEEEKQAPAGAILAIREESDELTSPCDPWKDDPELAPDLVGREILIQTSKRHGFIYTPIPEWVEPIVEFASLPR
jgi:dienelactone hydrolase